MSVKYTDNSLELIATRQNKISLALRFMLADVQKFAEPNTPMKHGNLRADVIKAVTGLHGEIIWDKKYARAQERGLNFKHYTTPGTGAHFAQNAVAKVIQANQTYFTKAGL